MKGSKRWVFLSQIEYWKKTNSMWMDIFLINTILCGLPWQGYATGEKKKAGVVRLAILQSEIFKTPFYSQVMFFHCRDFEISTWFY